MKMRVQTEAFCCQILKDVMDIKLAFSLVVNVFRMFCCTVSSKSV